jgi:acyl carrier protein
MTPLTEDDVRRFLLDHFSATIAATGVNPTELVGDFDLLAAGVVDSLGVIEMISAVEQHFKITVDFESMDPAELTMLGKFSCFVAKNAVSSRLSP